MHSPYRPGAGVMPPYLAGRSDEIRRAEALLARTEHYGGPADAPFILTGDRGLGKTVTLHAIANKARQRGFSVVSLTADRLSSLPHRLAAGVGEAVAASEGKRGSRKWRDRLNTFSVEITVAGVVTLSSNVDVKDAPVDRDALASLIADGATRLRSVGKKGLIVSVDEFQDASESALVVVTNVLQDVMAGKGPVVAVGAGLPNTSTRLMKAGSFAERFTYRELGLLTEEEATEALLNPASAVGVTWTQDAAELVLAAAKGSPWLVQLYGNATWLAANPKPGGKLSAKAAQAGVTDGRRDLWAGQFRGRWNRATPAEQRLMTAIAQQLGADDVAAASEVYASLGRTGAQVSTQRAALIEKGLVRAPGRGQLAFTTPGFEEFVLWVTDGGGHPRT